MPICFNDMSRHLSVYITQLFRYVKTRWQNRFSSQNCFLKNHEIIKQNQTFESTIGKPKLIRAPQSLFCSIDWFRPLALEDTNVHFSGQYNDSAQKWGKKRKNCRNTGDNQSCLHHRIIKVIITMIMMFTLQELNWRCECECEGKGSTTPCLHHHHHHHYHH